MESCFFCLDPLGMETISNPIGCSCKIAAHSRCLQSWFQKQNQMECPICHTKQPAPISVPVQIPVVVYLQDAQISHRTYTMQQKMAGIFCFLIMGWVLGFTIVELITHP